MSYRYDREKKTRRILWVSIIIFLLLSTFTPLYSFLYNSMEKPFISAYKNTADLKKVSKNIFHTWYTKKKLVEENKILEQKIKILEIDNLRLNYLESLLEKNTIIDKAIPQIFSSVIRKNNIGTLTILGGLDNNLSVGDLIVHNDGTLLGDISHVYSKSSYVSLFNLQGKKTNVILFPEDVSIIMTGTGNGMVSDVPREINVTIGNKIYSQEKPGVIIGQVAKIDFDPRDPSKRVYIKPIHSIENLQTISVIKKTLNE